jgi:hypothetical protein
VIVMEASGLNRVLAGATLGIQVQMRRSVEQPDDYVFGVGGYVRESIAF